ATSLDDYPKLGLDGSHIIIGANNFDAINELAPEQTAHILVAPKPGSGTNDCSSPPTFTVFGSKASPLMTSAGNQASTPEPATIADTTSTTGYVVSADFDDSTQDFSGNKIMVWHISTATPPTLVADGDVSVPTFGVPPD